MVAIHQFVHSYVDHDATSTHARHLQKIIASLGIQSNIYAGEWRGEKCKATYFHEYKPNQDDLIIYHLATASPMVEYLKGLNSKLAINYHNLTPYKYLAPWEPMIAPELELARKQLASLAPMVRFAIGASRFSEQDLKQLGYTLTTSAPILFEPETFVAKPDQATGKRIQSLKSHSRVISGNAGHDWLFVGRLAPHKCQHEIIKAFAIYKREYDKQARLHLVGGIASHLYWTVLNQFIDRLDLSDSIFLTKGVSDATLGAYYSNCDVFVCLSEHEGFGVPVLEAMHYNLPVVAYNSSAVGEIAGDGALVMEDKSPSMIATAVNKILSDDKVRSSLVKKGEERVKEFSLIETEKKWKKIIEAVVNSCR